MAKTDSEQTTAHMARAIERVTILWIVSTVLMLMAIGVVTLLARTKLRQQAAVIARQTETIDALTRRLDQIELALATVQRDLAQVRLERTTRPSAEPAAATPKPAETPTARLSERDIRRQLDQFLPEPANTTSHIEDVDAARELVSRVAAAADQLQLGGRTWARIALLAVLADHHPAAASLAQRARNAGVPPAGYDELRLREMLARKQYDEALRLGERLLAEAPDRPAARVLLAAAQAERGQLDRADRTLRTLPLVTALSDEDRLRLAQVLMRLARWDDLHAVLANWRSQTEQTQRLVNRYRAVDAIEHGRYATGVAILDQLLASEPDDYDLRLWRAIALVRAGQFQAAGDALNHPALQRERPEAWYWRGRLALATGHPEDAAQPLERAIRIDPRFALAWEALGSLALNAGMREQAITRLQRAIQADPRRATSYFLLAVAHAGAGDRAAAVAALRRAIARDPSLAQTAKDTQAITAIIPPEQIDQLTGRLPASQPTTEPRP